MADYASPPPISLSQPHHRGAGDHSPSSDNDSSDHATPPFRPTTSSKSLRRPISSSSPPQSSDHGSKKPRGRPPGSKNKPKPAVVVSKEPNAEAGMKPIVLEISAGSDVVDSVVKFAVRRRVGLTLLSGSGSVSNVTLRHPVPHAPAVISLHGPFSILSLSGSIVPPETLAAGAKPSFGICLAGAQGQVFGGIVGGKVVAAGAVVVVAAMFAKPSFHRIAGDARDPDADQHDESKPSAGGGAEVGSTSGSIAGYSGGGAGGGGGVTSPTPINCQLSSPDHPHHQQHHHHQVMPGWAHSSRSPY